MIEELLQTLKLLNNMTKGKSVTSLILSIISICASLLWIYFYGHNLIGSLGGWLAVLIFVVINTICLVFAIFSIKLAGKEMKDKAVGRGIAITALVFGIISLFMASYITLITLTMIIFVGASPNTLP